MTRFVLMRSGWDPPKSARDTRERGLPFEIAMGLFDGSLACSRPIKVSAMPTDPHFRTDRDLARTDWRRVDAITDEDIARQAAADADTAPVFTAEDIFAAGRRIVPEDVEDVRAPPRGSGFRRRHSQPASASRSTPSGNTKAIAIRRRDWPARCCV